MFALVCMVVLALFSVPQHASTGAKPRNIVSQERCLAALNEVIHLVCLSSSPIPACEPLLGLNDEQQVERSWESLSARATTIDCRSCT